MFDRCNDAVRIALLLARYQASVSGANEVGCNHLLAALLVFQWELFELFLGERANASQLRLELHSGMPVSGVHAQWDMPISSELKQVICCAVDEADRLGHGEIDSAHLLLGMLRQEQSASAELLRRCGLGLGRLREHMAAKGEQIRLGLTGD